ncbi:oligosaccharide flippase family protein [Chryseobacterium sp.]|jgi:O-antigen/teichoic acid export membrane protein|uniref:lipopolysaccharide biosynthesis protein n=1 Tax=Chryseobacterium sp. TaxID=1871047 RepID=UPI002847E01D|nr:oligosaccharide flippase family protein [Chryseobacterium sp.]MDR3022550.1 oligosaccharide flippase family protein [Chryseobacterium sp.]
METSKILKNTLIYSVGTIGSKILSFLLVPILTFYLNKEQLGIYDLLMTLILFLSPIISFQLSESIYRFIKSDTKISNYKAVISNAFILLLLSIIVFEVIFMGINFFVKYDYFIYFSICLITSILYPVFQKIVRAFGNNKLFTAIGLFNSILILILNIFFLKFLHLGLVSLFLSLIISNLISIIVIIFNVSFFKYFSFKEYNKDKLLELLKYSAPLIPNSISWWLINSSDKFLIALFLTLNDNGIYAISTKYPVILILINSIFILAFQDEKLVDTNNSNLDKESTLFNRYIDFQFSCGLLLISCSKLLITLTVATEYLDSYKYMMFLFTGVVFSSLSSYVGVYLMRENNTLQILKSSLIGGIINILFVLLFIKSIGLYACAIGSILGFYVLYYIRYDYLNKKYGFSVNNYKILIYLAVTLITSAVFIYFESIYVNLLIFLFIALFIIINRPIINTVFRKYGR